MTSVVSTDPPGLARLPRGLPFTTATARECGASRMQVSRLVETGHLRRMLRGVYVDSAVPESIDLRCAALRLALPDDAFLCDRTAAWLYTGPGALGPNEHLSVPPISVFRPSRRRSQVGATAAAGERAVREEDLRELNGLVVTTELRTALDLGRLQSTRDLRLWGMDNLINTGAFSIDQLLAEIPRFNGERGVIGLRALAPLVRAGSQSFGESSLRLRWTDAGLPEPTLQCPVLLEDGTVYYLDLADEEHRFAAEYDGAEWHSSPEQVEHDLSRRTRIEEEALWMIEIFERRHVYGTRQDAETRLRRTFREARRNLGQRLWTL